MDAVVDDVSAGVFPEPVPMVVEAVGIEGALRGGAEPSVVVDAIGGIAVGLDADVGARFHVDDAAKVNVAEFSGGDVFFGGDGVGG